MDEFSSELEIFLGMKLKDLPIARHSDTSKRHWDNPLSCAKCGAPAMIYYHVGTWDRWLDLCLKDSEELVTAQNTDHYTA